MTDLGVVILACLILRYFMAPFIYEIYFSSTNGLSKVIFMELCSIKGLLKIHLALAVLWSVITLN